MRWLAPLFLALPLCAEFRQIEFAVTGMDCMSCVDSLARKFRRIKGVESADVNTQKSVATLKLGPENNVRFERIRDDIKAAGFTPGEARVVVRGKAITMDGKWRLEVGPDQVYTLAGPDNDVLGKIRSFDGQMVTIEATVTAPSDPRTPLALQARSVKRAE